MLEKWKFSSISIAHPSFIIWVASHMQFDFWVHKKKFIIYCSLVQLAAMNSNLIPLIVSSLCVKKVEIFLKLNRAAFFHHTTGFTHAIWFLSTQKKFIIYCSLVQLAAMNSNLIPLIVSLLCLKKVEIFLKIKLRSLLSSYEWLHACKIFGFDFFQHKLFYF